MLWAEWGSLERLTSSLGKIHIPDLGQDIRVPEELFVHKVGREESVTSVVPTNPPLLMTLSPSLLPVPPSFPPSFCGSLFICLHLSLSACGSCPSHSVLSHYRCPFPRHHMFSFMPMQACWSP